jgi:glycosyltransferase involved in cell wall biosynthesis
MFRVAIVGFRLEKPDVVIGSIQPLFTGAAALAVAKVKRVPFVLEVRDLWPDALVVKGAMGRRTAAPLFWLAKRLYRNADRIVSLTPGIKREIVGKGISAGKIDVFPNGFDPELYSEKRVSRQSIRETYDWGEDLVFIYTGSFTEVTAVEVLVRAANQVKDCEGIRFEFFGNGPTRKSVEALSEEIGASNVTFHDPVPKVEVPGLLAGADVALMSLFVSPLEHIYFENKFIDYMGAGKPILAAMAGEQAEIMNRFGTGRAVPAFDSDGLAEMVAAARADFVPFAEMGQRGVELVREKLMLPDILGRYSAIVEKVAAGRGGELKAWEPFD